MVSRFEGMEGLVTKSSFFGDIFGRDLFPIKKHNSLGAVEPSAPVGNAGGKLLDRFLERRIINRGADCDRRSIDITEKGVFGKIGY